MTGRFLRRLTVRRRIVGGFLALALLLVLSVPLIVTNHYFLVGRLQHVTNVETRVDRLLLLASSQVASSRVNLMRYASDYAPSPHEALDNIDLADQLLTEARDLIPSSDQKEAVTAVLEILADYKALIGDVQAAHLEKRGTSPFFFQTYRLGNYMEQQIEEIVKESKARVTAANKDVYDTSQRRLTFLVSGYAVVLILTLVLARLIERSITHPVAELRSGAEAFRQGNLETTVPVVGSDELSLLAQTLNQMAANLRASQARQEGWSHELEEQVAERTHELRQAYEEQQCFLRTIREMSIPVIPVMEGILVTPIMGTLDSERAQQIMSDILDGIEHQRARVIILDITALAVMDTAVANTLLQTARATQLLGAQTILVGIAPEVAETLVQLGIDLLHDLRTAATLQEGLHLALNLLRRRIISA